MIGFWQKLADVLLANRRAFVCLVVANEKGSPGTAGARMIVEEHGGVHGTIGGGIMELRLVERARAELDAGTCAPMVETLQHKSAGGGVKSGLICSGSQTNLSFMCDPERDLATAQTIAAIRADESEGEVCISPEGLSARRDTDINPGDALLEESDDGWLYRESLFNPKRLAIIGGGHCSLALCRQMGPLGYSLTVFETRRDVFTLREDAGPRRVRILDRYERAGKQILHPELTYVVLMTPDFHSDVDGLRGLHGLPFPYIGVLGSRAKIARIRKELKKAGIAPSWLDQIHAPAGLPIDSDTPAEIAVSIAAEILQIRNGDRN